MLTLKELRGFSTKELQDELAKLHRSLLEMRMALTQSQLKKTSDIRVARKQIARIKTILVSNAHEEASKKKKSA